MQEGCRTGCRRVCADNGDAGVGVDVPVVSNGIEETKTAVSRETADAGSGSGVDGLLLMETWSPAARGDPIHTLHEILTHTNACQQRNTSADSLLVTALLP